MHRNGADGISVQCSPTFLQGDRPSRRFGKALALVNHAPALCLGKAVQLL